MSTNHVAIEGNLVRDIELRYGGQSNTAVGGGAIAYNPRVRNKDSGEWEDGEPSFFDFVLFGEHAENVAESIAKGQRVMVVGRLQQDHWQDKETGDNRSKVKIVAEAVTPVLRWAQAAVTKSGGGGGNASRDGAFDGVDMAEI